MSLDIFVWLRSFSRVSIDWVESDKLRNDEMDSENISFLSRATTCIRFFLHDGLQILHKYFRNYRLLSFYHVDLMQLQKIALIEFDLPDNYFFAIKNILKRFIL